MRRGACIVSERARWQRLMVLAEPDADMQRLGESSTPRPGLRGALVFVDEATEHVDPAHISQRWSRPGDVDWPGRVGWV